VREEHKEEPVKIRPGCGVYPWGLHPLARSQSLDSNLTSWVVFESIILKKQKIRNQIST
jgi:hypothetical protein